MSDIDIVRHVRVGHMVGIPVYLCLEDGCWVGSGHEPQPSSVARRHAICIGGGSGEHPALVINDARNCVAIYLQQYGSDMKEISAQARVPTNRYMVYCSGMTKQKWSEDLSGPYLWTRETTFDRWIALNVGEFVYHVLPDLHPMITKWKTAVGEVQVWNNGIGVPWDTATDDMFRIRRSRLPNKQIHPIAGKPGSG